MDIAAQSTIVRDLATRTQATIPLAAGRAQIVVRDLSEPMGSDAVEGFFAEHAGEDRAFVPIMDRTEPDTVRIGVLHVASDDGHTTPLTQGALSAASGRFDVAPLSALALHGQDIRYGWDSHEGALTLNMPSRWTPARAHPVRDAVRGALAHRVAVAGLAALAVAGVGTAAAVHFTRATPAQQAAAASAQRFANGERQASVATLSFPRGVQYGLMLGDAVGNSGGYTSLGDAESAAKTTVAHAQTENPGWTNVKVQDMGVVVTQSKDGRYFDFAGSEQGGPHQSQSPSLDLQTGTDPDQGVDVWNQPSSITSVGAGKGTVIAVIDGIGNVITPS